MAGCGCLFLFLIGTVATLVISLSAVGCTYTVVMAEDVHCVHMSCLLGLVSTPLLSVQLVAGTLW